MDLEYLKKLDENPNFIPDIDHYCDSWCERCAFTARCLNYASHQHEFPDSEMQDIANERFWQKLMETLQFTTKMLKEIVEKEGIDLNSPDIEASMAEAKRCDDLAWDHEYSQAAKAYGQMVEKWFSSAQGLFEDKAEQLDLTVRLELPEVNPVKDAASIKDAIDVIYWYQYQIFIKLVIAVRGTMDDHAAEPDEYRKHSDGHAKVALIGIDRSIAAWAEMRNHFSEREDEILDLLIFLDRLRRNIEKLFPAARAFIRPGFDEIED